MAMTVLDPTTFRVRTVPDPEGAALLASGWLLAPGGSGGGGASNADVAGFVTADGPTKTVLSATYVQATAVRNMVRLTRAAFDALGSISATTVYLIVEPNGTVTTHLAPLPGDGLPPDFARTDASLAAAKAAPGTLYSTTSPALYDPVTNRTFLVYLGVQRVLYATYYDHGAGTWATPVAVGAYATATNDNHGAPSLTLGSDGRLCVAWGNHNAVYLFSRSTNPRDISAWTTANNVLPAGTYSNLRRDPLTGDLLLFHRSGTEHGPTYPSHEFYGCARSIDQGATWTHKPIIDSTATPETMSDPYVYDIVRTPNDKWAFVWTMARGAVHDGVRLNFYYAVYDPNASGGAGTWTNAAGVDFGPVLDWNEHSQCLVAEAGASGEAGIIRLAFAPDGTPWVVYADGGASSAQPYVARWTGTAWAAEALPLTLAYTFAFPALRFLPSGELDVYLTGIRPTGWAVSQCHRYRKVNGVWTRLAIVAYGEDNSAGIERCLVPVGARDGAALLYQSSLTDHSQGDPTATSNTFGLYAAPAGISLVELPAPGVPKTAFTDNFNRSNGAVSNGWTDYGGGAYGIVSNAFKLTAGTAPTTYYIHQGGTQATTADQYAEITPTVFPGTATTPHPYVGVRIARGTSTDKVDGYYARWNPTSSSAGTWQILKVVNGAATVIANSASESTPATGYRLRIEASSSSITVKVGGTTKVTITDTALTAGRSGGVAFRYTASADLVATIDDFAFGDL